MTQTSNFPCKPDIAFDRERNSSRNILYRTAIYKSTGAAIIAETHLKRYWTKVQRVGFIVFASRKDKDVRRSVRSKAV
jgi:hypothetical protein